MVKELIEEIRKAQIALEDVKEISQRLIRENDRLENENSKLWNENEHLKKLGGKVE